MEKIALAIVKDGYRVVELKGFTDNVFTPTFNATLVQARAEVVEEQLSYDLAALGAKDVSITVETGATIELVDANATAPARAKNRRVDVTVKAH